MAELTAHILGCKVNFADAQKIYHQLSAGPAAHPAALVGTCCVTAEGEKQSRKQVRKAARSVGPGGKVYVTGCAARLDPEAFRGLAENVVVVSEVSTALPAGPAPVSDCPGIIRSRYFLKVQDGCANGCSYCVIPQVRGEPRGVALTDIMRSAREAVGLGYPELVITGIDTGAWQSAAAALPVLLESLAGIHGLKRLRLSSIEINHLTDELISVIKDIPIIGRHLHLPLQSGDDGVLRSMNRKYRRRDFLCRMEEVQEQIPEINITTDLIAGFPTEDDAAFSRTLDFIEEAGFTKIHVFTYSARPGTRSLHYGDPVDPDEKKRRSRRARRLSDKLQRLHCERKVGSLNEVLLEYRGDKEICAGYSSDYTRFLVEGGDPGEMALVRGRSVTEKGVTGEMIKQDKASGKVVFMHDEKECLFCRIARGEVEADRIWEDDRFVAFKDKFPKAPTHVLIIPREHIDWLNDIGDTDDSFCRDMLRFVVDTADKLGVKETGYRVINNVGSGGGQLIFHLHWHLLAGKSVGFNLEDSL